MYTEEQYQRAKKAIDDPNIEEDFKKPWRTRVAEYEATQLKAAASASANIPPPPPPAPVTNDAANAVSAYEDQHPPQPPTAGEHNMDAPAPLGVRKPGYKPADYQLGRANASQLTRFTDQTENISSRPLASLAKNMLLDPLAGPSKSLYFEPTEEQFQDAQGPYLAVHDIRPGTDDYNRTYARYKDVQWEKAYQQAVAEDRPITRTEYVKRSNGWQKLGDELRKSADTGAAFAQGYANSLVPGGPDAAAGIDDRLTGRDTVSEDRAREARSPAAYFAGSVLGGFNKRALGNQVAGLVGKMAPRAVPSLRPLGTSVLAGGAASGFDYAGNTAGQTLADTLHGRPLDDDMKSHFTAGLLGAVGGGGVAGALGEYLASRAHGLRGHFRSPTSKLWPELPQLDPSGSTTDFIHGVKPSPGVEDILKRASGPVPGEAKEMLMGGLMGEASKGLPEPIVAQQNKEYDLLVQALKDHKGEMVRSNPKLLLKKGPKTLIQRLREALILRSKATAEGKYLPSSEDELGANKNDPFIDIVRKSTRARVVPTVDAAQEAARTGGHVATIQEARGLGFPVKNWENDVPSPGGSSIGDATHPDTTQPDLGATHPGSGSYANVSDSELLPDGTRPTFDTPTRERVIESGRPPANSNGPDFQGMLNSAPPPANTYAELHIMKGIPESEYRVILDAEPLDALKTEDLIDSIDRAGKASNKKGDQDPIWKPLFEAARADRRANFGDYWADQIHEHHVQLNQIENRGYNAGIHERAPYAEMSPDARAKVDAKIRNYGLGEDEKPNAALAELASNAAGDTRQKLEDLKGARAYVSLKRQASPQAAVTPQGGLLRVGGLLPGVGLRVDAAARALERGPVGEVIFHDAERMPFVAKRELLPTSGFWSLGRGALGAKTGAVIEAENRKTRPATGSIDPEQQAIIENYLNEP